MYPSSSNIVVFKPSDTSPLNTFQIQGHNLPNIQKSHSVNSDTIPQSYSSPYLSYQTRNFRSDSVTKDCSHSSLQLDSSLSSPQYIRKIMEPPTFQHLQLTPNESVKIESHCEIPNVVQQFNQINQPNNSYLNTNSFQLFNQSLFPQFDQNLIHQFNKNLFQQFNQSIANQFGQSIYSLPFYQFLPNPSQFQQENSFCQPSICQVDSFGNQQNSEMKEVSTIIFDRQKTGDEQKYCEIKDSAAQNLIQQMLKISSNNIKQINNSIDQNSRSKPKQTNHCSFRNRIREDNDISLTSTTGASSGNNHILKNPLITPHPSDQINHSIYFDQFKNTNHSKNNQNSTIPENERLSENQIDGIVASKESNDEEQFHHIIDKYEEVEWDPTGKSFFLTSSYKKRVISSLDDRERQILFQMKKCKKFNFSKNVIKQFLKVMDSDVSYKYVIGDAVANQAKMNGKPNNKLIIQKQCSSNLKGPFTNQRLYNEEMQKLIREMKSFLSCHSYTHSSIKKIIQHPQYSLYFRDFLENHTSSWIDNGKTKYKQEQYIMIDFLKLCIQNKRLLIFLSQHDPIKIQKHIQNNKLTSD